MNALFMRSKWIATKRLEDKAGGGTIPFLVNNGMIRLNWLVRWLTLPTVMFLMTSTTNNDVRMMTSVVLLTGLFIIFSFCFHSLIIMNQ